jgi:hypothetical protein
VRTAGKEEHRQPSLPEQECAAEQSSRGEQPQIGICRAVRPADRRISDLVATISIAPLLFFTVLLLEPAFPTADRREQRQPTITTT